MRATTGMNCRKFKSADWEKIFLLTTPNLGKVFLKKKNENQRRQSFRMLTFNELLNLAAHFRISLPNAKSNKVYIEVRSFKPKTQTKYSICTRLFFRASLEMFSWAPGLIFYIWPPGDNLENHLTNLSEETCSRLCVLASKLTFPDVTMNEALSFFSAPSDV